MSVTISGSGQIVKQVISATYATATTTTSTSFVATGLTASITPTNSANKILVIIGFQQMQTTGGVEALYSAYRNTTNLGGTTKGFGELYNSGNVQSLGNITYLDSPATTSATTYTLYYKSGTGTAIGLNNGDSVSTITLMEIAYA